MSVESNERRIYLASSWRNPHQPQMVAALRTEGHSVYDFRNPAHGVSGFAWSDIDPNWEKWTIAEYRHALGHPVAERGFAYDLGAMEWADTFILVLPCGRSAHLELGWATGRGKPSAIVSLDTTTEPELMYLLADFVAANMPEVLSWLDELEDTE